VHSDTGTGKNESAAECIPIFWSAGGYRGGLFLRQAVNRTCPSEFGHRNAGWLASARYYAGIVAEAVFSLVLEEKLRMPLLAPPAPFPRTIEAVDLAAHCPPQCRS
jgi:hypothetical protein